MRNSGRRRQSYLALWSRRAGLSAIPVLLLAIIGHRADVIDAEVTLALLAIGLTLAFCAILAAIIALGAVWREGRKGFGAATFGLLLGILLLAYPTFLLTRMLSLPAIADIATNREEAPEFTMVAWEHPVVPAASTERILAAYPDARPRVYLADPEVAFEEVVATVAMLGWEIVGQSAPAASPITTPLDPSPGPAPPPTPPAPTIPGYVEATARTLVVGFREDIAIRVAADPAGTVIDIRSASRIFQHDFGSNAARIARFFNELDDRLVPFSTN